MFSKIKLFVLFSVLIVMPSFVNAVHYEVIDIRKTSHIENGWVRVAPSLSVAERTVIYHITLNLRAGDIVEATAQMELTNSSGKVYGVGRGIAISQNPNYPIETWVNPVTFSYLNIIEHHGVYTMSGDYTVLEDGLYSVSLIVYSAAYKATDLDYLKIEQEYGFLNVKVYRQME